MIPIPKGLVNASIARPTCRVGEHSIGMYATYRCKLIDRFVGADGVAVGDVNPGLKRPAGAASQDLARRRRLEMMVGDGWRLAT